MSARWERSEIVLRTTATVQRDATLSEIRDGFRESLEATARELLARGGSAALPPTDTDTYYFRSNIGFNPTDRAALPDSLANSRRNVRPAIEAFALGL